MSQHRIDAYGAVADPAVDSAAAIQAAVDAAHRDGGGTVVVPAGRAFMAGSIRLKSGVRLHLEPGSVLRASPDIGTYLSYGGFPRFEMADFHRFWLFAEDAERVTIDGDGTLDGNSPAFTVARHATHTEGKNPRAQSLVFLRCRDVAVRDVRIVDTPSWAIRPMACDRVRISGVTILNDLGLVNSDGIDVDGSRAVRIEGCHIEAGDDAISLKGRYEIADFSGPVEDVVVTGCVLESHCCAIRLGAESHVDFRRIVVSGCTIRRSHRGIAIDCRDDAVVEDVLFSDLAIETIHSPAIWWHEGEPIWICQVPDVPGHYGPASRPARMRNVVFRNLAIVSEGGIVVQGCDPADGPPPRDLRFEDVNVHMVKRTPHPCGFADPRPHRSGFVPAGATGVADTHRWGSRFVRPTSAWFLDRAEDVTLRRCRVTWERPLPPAHAASYAHALEAHAVRGLTLDDFRGEAARPDLEAIRVVPPAD